MTLSRQQVVNRENAVNAGVKTEEGKAISRLNAGRHGIFTSALTPEDAEELYGVEERLVATLRPVGNVEKMLVEKLALTYLRMQRCARAEAEYHVRTWEEVKDELSYMEADRLKKRRDAGIRAVAFKYDVFTRMVDLIGLYDQRLTSQFLRILHEVERRQRMRSGENVPPPIVGDLVIPQASVDENLQPTEGQVDNCEKAI